MGKKRNRSKPPTRFERALKKAIEKSGLTHSALAELAKGAIDQPRLSRYMRGEIILTAPAIGAIADALDLELKPRKKRPAKQGDNNATT